MSDFPLHTPDTTTGETSTLLAGIQKKLGFIPSMYAKQAEAPVLMEAYRTVSAIFEKSSFSNTERNIVSLASSYEHNCDFCMTAHSWIGRSFGMDEAVLTALRTGQPIEDTKLEALRVFTVAVMQKRGAVSPEEKQAFFDAGYGTQQALEVILGIAAKVMTNYTNAMAHTPTNPEFGEENIWHKK